ncbi:MAG: tetratricopeptide repeat protein, partial [Candidatus Omnitrophica bacterium]|nr:tetratricopeptide repeat protein [Candidatus Omnitrophota bacterium]
DSAYAAVENSLENQRTLGMRIALAQEKQKAAEADMNQSVRIIELAKNAANSVWLEYSAAKNELTNLLDQGGENSLVSAAQKKYDSSKAALENALNAVDQAKKDSDAKAAAYETAKKELESLKMSAQDPAKDVTGAQKRYEQNKERLGGMEKKVAQARQEVANAERAHKQYELEKADAEYKKSLQAIDSSLASKLEEERLQNEARQRKVEEDNAREKARLAALEKLQTAQKPEEVQVVPEDESAKAVAPKRRMAQSPVKKTSAPQSVRSEVLKSAVELRNAGLEMQRNGDMDSAVKYYQQALMQDPNYATVHNDLGILYEQKGLDEKAKTEYMEALRIDKYYLRAHSNLALLYEKLGDYDKAHYHWKQRVQLGKSDDPWTQKARERMEALEKRK